MTHKNELSTHNAYDVTLAHRMVTIVDPKHHLYGEKLEFVKVGGCLPSLKVTVKYPTGIHFSVPLNCTDYVELLEDDPTQKNLLLLCAEHLKEAIKIIASVLQDD